MKTDSTDDEQKPRGFDAGVKRREYDFLNRWPLARGTLTGQRNGQALAQPLAQTRVLGSHYES
jgi:hypothetical protein